ncbi:MAG: hypothetical protein AAF722_03475 [Cyanobacteria bacterium P01_C01_bin.70]
MKNINSIVADRSKLLGTIALIALFMGGVAALQRQRWQTLFAAQDEELTQQAELETQKLAAQVQILQNIPALGFRNLIADWAFLQYVQYFGNREQRQITGYGLVEDYFEVIIDRDPYAYDPYIFLSTSLTLYTAQPQRAVELQEQGLQSLSPQLPPNSFYIWRQKGVDEILFLGDYEAAIRSHEIATDWATQSAAPGAEQAAQSFSSTAEFIKNDPENPQVQANAWLQVVASAQDEQTRSIAIEQIEAAGYELVQLGDARFTVRPKAETSTSEP